MPAAGQHNARVLISGLGPVSCLGFGLEHLTEGILEQAVAQEIERIGPRGRREAALIPDFDLQELIETSRPYLDPQSRSALAAGALALESAAVQHDEVNPLRCGLCYATMLGNLDTQALFQRMVDQKGMRLGSPVLFSHSYPNSTDSLLAIEFALRGYNQNFCGDLLCGAQALESALLALRSGRADLVLAGGADVVRPEVLERLHGGMAPSGPAPAQGAALLVLETQDSIERREGYAFCELSSVVCQGTQGRRNVPGLADALRGAVGQAMGEAGVWEGYIGVVVLCSWVSLYAEAAEAERKALDGFSQVPMVTAKRYLGETFAAGFPLECTVAADVLSDGFVPPKVAYQGKRRGVEFWLERRPEAMLGNSALVVGCTCDLVAAAVLRAL